MRLAPSRMRPRLQAGIGCVTKATWGRPVNARAFIVLYPRIEQPYGALLRRAYEPRQPVKRLFSAVSVAPSCHASCLRQCRNRFGWGGCGHVHDRGSDPFQTDPATNTGCLEAVDVNK
jgi:hypothetical protein